jgi:hypothetical protein
VCLAALIVTKFTPVPILRKYRLTSVGTSPSKANLCYRCLGTSHRGAECRSSRPCSTPGCNKTHHRSLHSERERVSSNMDVQAPALVPASITPQSNSASHTASANQASNRADCIAMRTIPIISTDGNRELRVNALLDEGSND